MNRQLPFFAMIFIIGCKSQSNKYFTGTIEYTYTYSSDSLDADSLAKTRPFKSLLRYDTIDYQSRFIGVDTSTYYYSGKFNKSLSETDHLENYECEDYGVFTDSVISFTLIDTDEKILGYSCKILEIQKMNSWLRYYISNELKIAPATYRQHKSYNWDVYGDKANGGLILRSEHHFKYFTMKGIATAIEFRAADFKALEIDEKLFSQFCK